MIGACLRAAIKCPANIKLRLPEPEGSLLWRGLYGLSAAAVHFVAVAMPIVLSAGICAKSRGCFLPLYAPVPKC